MSKTEKKRAMAFTFGEPETVLQGQLSQHLGVFLLDNGQYYQTPMPLVGLARLLRANAYHWPTLEFKTNMVMKDFRGSAALSRKDAKKLSTDYNVFANAYLQRRFNLFGQVVKYDHLPAINMRRASEPDRYCMLDANGKIILFEPGEVLHICNYDVAQNIYGLPSYVGAIQSMLLQEDATLFRRRYYKNGAHMGYVFYSSSPALDPGDEEAIRDAVRTSKGVGNFRNLFLHIPNGREKDVQILPVGDFSTRDELEKIKNISRDDIIAAHRIPPALANIIPSVAGGLGDIEKADRVYVENEIIPLRDELAVVNEELPAILRVSFGEKAVYGSVEIQAKISEDETPQNKPTDKVKSEQSGDVQQLAMNGAQSQALQAIVVGVATGEFPKETGKAVIKLAFPASTDEQVNAIIDPIVVKPPQREEPAA